jgi:prephenate dehydrogenase
MSRMAEFDTVAIVGVGLIGGSIGLALRERSLARSVVGIGRRQVSLDTALRQGAIDRATTDLAEGVAAAELVVVCTPVDTVVELVVGAASASPASALITDAGSTKQVIVTAIEKLLPARGHGPTFVGSHPVAGDHRSGPVHARADLLDGRTVVVTPIDSTPLSAVDRISGFWRSLGAMVTIMTPAEHDAALAATSHLPHLVAAALAAATPPLLLPLAASGWRDTTRVAGANPDLWRPIFSSNRHEVLAALDRFSATIDQMRDALDRNDDRQLTQLLEQARRTKSEHDALGD